MIIVIIFEDDDNVCYVIVKFNSSCVVFDFDSI